MDADAEVLLAQLDWVRGVLKSWERTFGSPCRDIYDRATCRCLRRALAKDHPKLKRLYRQRSKHDK